VLQDDDETGSFSCFQAESLSMNQWHFAQAARVLQDGGVIAYPTEAVWGLGCDPFNEKAVNRLLALKKRPVEKGVILVASSVEQIAPLFDPLTDSEKEKLLATWPGPNTWLLPDPDNLIPQWIKGEHDSVAVRISAHAGVAALCDAFGGCIVSTSANPAGSEPARSLLRVSVYFARKADYIVPGNIGKLAQPTRIQDLRDSRVVRS
jgi:L-threonylcarbamoyladenylate synthase